MVTLRLILGDQLNPEHRWFRIQREDVIYIMMEILPETSYVKHHIQKLLAYLGAMRSFANHLRSTGHRVHYIKLDDPENLQSFGKNLKWLSRKYKAKGFQYLLPDEYRVDKELDSIARDSGLKLETFDTEHFLSSRHELEDFFSNRKTYLMESFYRYMRKKFGVLMAGDQPLGGKWNFDIQNRKKYQGDPPVPAAFKLSHNHTGIKSMLDKMNVKYFGECNPADVPWPVNRSESLELLEYFVTQLLPHFGTFQDAMDVEQQFLFHSRLSFSLNTKMLGPKEVIDRVEKALLEEKAEVNEAEGFIRQILGWREYMRGIYWVLMPGLSRMNYFEHHQKLPGFYWTGATRMNCMRHAIRQSLEEAYAHHIQRLMITGNFALLAGVNPAEVDEWYLGIYIDAIEWVEITNTRGMSQYADGGLIATKPYVSSASYINKMSNYCNGCHYNHKLRTGEKACPFNSLYWNFIERNRKRLESNPRMSMMYRTWEKFPSKEKEEILKQAKNYLDTIEEL